MRRRFVLVSTLVLASLSVPVRVLANPITLIEGDDLFAVLDVGAAGEAGAVDNNVIFQLLFPGTTREFNDSPVGAFSTLFNNPIVFGTITGASVSSSITTYAISAAGLPLEKIIVTPGGVVQFALTITSAEVDSLHPNTVVIRGTESLLADLEGQFDFSPFAAGGLFRLTLPTSPPVDVNAVLTNGGTLIAPNGTFQQSAEQQVPEAASLSLLGLALAGVGARRWRQRRQG